MGDLRRDLLILPVIKSPKWRYAGVSLVLFLLGTMACSSGLTETEAIQLVKAHIQNRSYSSETLSERERGSYGVSVRVNRSCASVAKRFEKGRLA